MEKMTGKSLDLVAENIEQLKKLFPEVVTEGKIDFEVLKNLLGGEIEDRQEYYKFIWNGKEAARAYARVPSMGTLRPCVKDSSGKDGTPGKFDSENLYIEGDNLEVLKLLQGPYHKKVKMIYIDPPYNTGKDFVYPDNYRDSLGNYKSLTGQTDEEGKATHANPETSGRYHTDWLNMIYPRLILARNLLADDGVIFISIDDSEQDNLKKLCDDVFGEENFVANFLWTKTATPPALSKKCRKTVEYVLAYEKSLSAYKYFGESLDNCDAPLLNTGNPKKTLVFPAGSVKFSFVKNGKIRSGHKEKTVVLDDIYVKGFYNTNDFRMSGEFKWEQATLDDEINKGTYFLVKTEAFSIRFQRVANDDSYKTPTNFLDVELKKDNGVGTNETASKELDALDMAGVFDYAKPTSLLVKLIKCICKFEKDALILDFFSGSGTLADSLLQFNCQDNSSISYILVQLPEDLDASLKNADASSAKTVQNAIDFCDRINRPHTLTEIGKERIRRAAKRIKEENPLFAGDMGFKVFKLDTSNFVPWNPNADELRENLYAAVDNVLDGRSTDDLLYEVLLKCNLPLTLPIESRKFGKNTVYVVGAGALAICLDASIPQTIAEEIVKLRDEFAPVVPMRVVFRDNGFTDVSKTNALQILKQAGFEEKSIQTI